MCHSHPDIIVTFCDGGRLLTHIFKSHSHITRSRDSKVLSVEVVIHCSLNLIENEPLEWKCGNLSKLSYHILVALKIHRRRVKSGCILNFQQVSKSFTE